MNFDNVAAELRAALDTIDGLRVVEWGVRQVHPPAALIGLPEQISYDLTYGRGTDRVEDWPVMVLLSRPNEPHSRRAIVEYVHGSGPKSVKQAIEAHTYTSCDDVQVVSAEFDVVTFAEADYLAAVFHLNVIGGGA
ncbi:hypothetical protein [Micromonospora globbae]|uniref:DUF3168 domain-containing protein n=1 Tax=Micromonospora globbae TaxID=1894969 RepID=A0A420ETX7_9ACTN|nr:hypothetical protein [Micromonospora globbae]RKF24138.1 hypothetical protein D7I43_28045 [Micromonospora globbae]